MKPDPDFRALYEEAFPAVYRSVYALCRDQASAEDATQEAFARALERWGRLRARPWIKGWLTTTAMNAVRRASRRRVFPQTTAELEHDHDSQLDLWNQVRELPRRQQEAVVLYYAEDLPVNQVSEVMGCREGTVRALLAQARERLRTSMEASLGH